MRLGSDPEVFLNDANGKFISVIGLIQAGKENPKQYDDLPQGFTEQEDNVAAEFGIPPAASREEFISHIRTVQQAFLKRRPQFTFSRLSCTIFPEDQMKDPMAYIFGCEPDFNAWTGEMNKKPEPPHKYMRSAGGHIHVETKLDAQLVGQAMDLTLAVPSSLMDKEGLSRRQLYGKHGSIRFKPYGVEYRTLSNFWIFDDRLVGWAWDQTARALDMVSQGLDLRPYHDLIEESVDKNNIDATNELVKTFNLTVL